MTWYNLKVQERQLIDEVIISADNIAQTVNYATKAFMLEGRKEKVQESLLHIAEKTEGIERLRLFNKKGAIKKSTNLEERGTVFAKSAEPCANCHAGDQPSEILDRNRRVRNIMSEDGTHRAIGLTHAIYNEKSCAQSCHAVHPARQKVLGVLDITMSLANVDKKIAENRRHLIQFGGAAFLLIMTPLGVVLFWFLIRPVNALVQGIEAVSRGNIKAEIPVYTQEEFGRLAKSFNTMLVKLRREIEYGNLMMYDPVAIESKSAALPAKGPKPEQKKQDALGSTFEEIYDRIKDETHLKLVRSVKLASLGQLSAGIAHEINNPLTAVLSYSSLLLEKAASPKEKAWLKIIVDETKRCRNIVAGLLEFSRQTAPEKILTDINDIIERAVNLLQNQESFHNISIVKKLDTGLPKVRIDRGQLYQVFMNLMINASDAMNQKGTLTIESRLNVVKSTVTADRRFVEVVFTDTGCGIPKEILERLFDPFFTTKGPTVGTGLGLSICYGIVRRHDGNIIVNSKPGEGATFKISLPAGGGEDA
ncbi:MAG: ATP-binding protein [Verrucomicrobiota bacterium]